MKQLPLKDFNILNTRPSIHAKKLNQVIEQLGGHAVELPLLSIKPFESKIWLRSLPAKIDILIFISPTAVYYSLKALKTNWPEVKAIYAIGPGTAEALRANQIKVDYLPPEANSTSLSNSYKLRNLDNKVIAIIKGFGGRDILEQQIVEQGGMLVTLDVYKRQCPDNLSENIIKTWNKNDIELIIITSLESFNNLINNTPSELKTKILTTKLLVISQRIAKHAESIGMSNIIVADKSDLFTALHNFKKEN